MAAAEAAAAAHCAGETEPGVTAADPAPVARSASFRIGARGGATSPAATPAADELAATIRALITGAEEARRRLDELSRAIDALAHRASGATVGAPAAATETERPRPPAGTDSETLASTARLIAIEMAVGGASRLEVQRRLTDQFGITEPRGLLDDVFGRGSDPGTRMPRGRRG